MIKEILKNKQEIEITNLKCWVISNRGNQKIRFVTVNDGSTFDNLQIVVKEGIDKVENIRMGSAVKVSGKIKLTPDAKQPMELTDSVVELIKNVDEDYPVQKKGINYETLREIPHMRHRTNTFRAVMRVRSTLSQLVHQFFMERNYLLMASPILTSNDGEGAGEAFIVDSEDDKEQFFNTKATLGVTGQLQGESYANGFGAIYTFAPTFRAEKSHTHKHLAEFWMIEPEVAFHTIEDSIGLANDLMKYTIKNTLELLKPEMEFLNEKTDGELLKRLNSVIENDIEVIDYKDAIVELDKVKDRFENKDLSFGVDLSTEHERYLCEELFKKPTAVINFPKDIKAFYMKQNEDGKTVSAFDILVHGVGELFGGSARECEYEKIEKRVEEMNIPKDEMQWYLDLRRFGHVESAGFGLGFERLVMFVTGMENIRDSIPYPRVHKSLKM